MNWLPVVGIENKFEISDTGLVRSIPNNRTAGKILKLSISLQGYYRFGYNLKGVHKNQPIHRMVAKAFIPNPLNLPQVNHKDGDKLNNYASNLEWSTAKDNINHAWNTGLAKRLKGSDNSFAKLDESKAREIRSKYIPRLYSQSKLAKEYGVSRSAIEKILHGEMWAHA